PPASRFEEERAIARREEPVTLPRETGNVLPSGHHDARRLAGAGGFRRDPGDLRAETLGARVARRAQRLREVVRTDEEDIDSGLVGDRRKVGEGALALDLHGDERVLVRPAHEIRQRDGGVAVRPHSSQAALAGWREL